MLRTIPEASKCALESVDAAIAVIPARKMTNLHGSRP